MSNFDDIFASVAVPTQPDNRPQWQIREQQNRENAYRTLDAVFEEYGNGTADVKSYLDVQSRFLAYSARNALLVQQKNPAATRLGDRKYWREQGFEVLRNEVRNPIIILEPGREYTREDGSVGQYYNAKEVYDISQTTGRDKVQPTVTLDERLLLKALISRSPVAIQVVDELPQGQGAAFDPEKQAILVRRGMSAPDIFRSVSLELAHADLQQETKDYSRSADGYKAYYASYLLCKRYDIDAGGYDTNALKEVLKGKEKKEIANSLDSIKDTAKSISYRMSRALEQNKLPKSKEQER